MALTSWPVIEIRGDGNDDNGGAFVDGGSGTDYSQQAAAQLSPTDIAVDSVDNTKITFTGHSSAYEGNFIYISGGAGFTTGHYELQSYDGTYYTLDRSPAAISTTGGSGNIGGALASFGGMGRFCQVFSESELNGLLVWVKDTATDIVYDQTGSNIPGGTLDFQGSGGAGSAGAIGFRIEGYSTTRGDLYTKFLAGTLTEADLPYIQGSTNSAGVYLDLNNTSAGRPRLICFIGYDGSGHTTNSPSAVIYGGNGNAISRVIGCSIINFGTNTARDAFDLLETYFCWARNGAGTGFDNCKAEFCKAENCNIGFNGSSHSRYCLAYENVDGFVAGNMQLEHCIAADNSGHGIKNLGAAFFAFTAKYCILAFNGGYGIDMSGSTNVCRNVILDTNAFYSNTSGTVNFDSGENEHIRRINDIILTGDPFTDRANDDYSLNNIAGAGAACRSSVFDIVNGGRALDLGAIQIDHQNSGTTLIIRPRRTL